MRTSPATICLAMLALTLSQMLGCAPLRMPETLVLPGQQEKFETPLRMTALWTNTVLVEAGVSGFGGRLMFYGAENDEPIKVEGELTVFAYDDTDEVKADRIPARKFVFRTEDFSKHYSESRLGHSYSFWVPWGQVGGPQRIVSLVARFKSSNGGVVMSEMTRHLLPGAQHPAIAASTSATQGATATSNGAQAAGAMANAVQATAVNSPATESAATNMAADQTVLPASHQQLLVNSQPASPTPGMSTTTITLPDALGTATSGATTADHALASGDGAISVNVPNSANLPAAALQDGASGRASPQLARAGSAAASSPSSSPDPTEIQAMVQAAVQEALASERAAQQSDRFGRQRRRARIAPKLPPTRAPAASPLHPAGSPFSPASRLPAGGATESAHVTGGLPTTALPRTATVR